MTLDEQQKSRDAVEKAVRAFCDAYQRRTPEATAHAKSVFADGFFGWGTGIDEVVRSREDIMAVVDRDHAETPDGMEIEIDDLLIRMHTNTVAGVMIAMRLHAPTPEGPVEFAARYTMTWQHRPDDGWQTVSAHMSVPWSAQVEGESMPTDALRAEAKRLEKEVAERTTDLQQANRELAVDAAIERIRRVTADMTDPSDLIEVVKQIRLEMDTLYGGRAVEVGLMQEPDGETFKFWSIFDADEVPEDLALFGLLYPKKPDPPHPMLDRVWSCEGAYSLLFFDIEDMWRIHASLERYSPEEAKTLKVVLESGEIDGGWQTVSSIQVGRMYFGWVEEPPEELATVQPRIAAVLSEAQKRVGELQTAKRMAREAEISLAIEKVRARASGMQTSEEIVDVADVLRGQLIELGLKDVLACTVYSKTLDGKHRAVEMARLEEGSPELSFDWVFDPADLHPDVSVHDILAAESMVVLYKDAAALELTKQEAAKFDANYVEDYEKALDENDISEIWIATCPSESIRLCLDFTTEPPDEVYTILPRMTRAFDHAYRRYQDLERAEAQTREALIETALERVRGRALAMRSSEEMIDVADELRRQMGLMGQNDLEACAIHIYDTEGDDFESWGAIRDPEGDQKAITNEIRLFPKKGVSSLEEAIARYESDENQYVIVNEGDSAIEFFDMMKERAPEPHAALMAQMPPGVKPWEMKAYWSVADFEGGSMIIVTYQPAAQESRDLLGRAAKVMDLAYRRFKDLRESEAATREAQIETALERIRSKTMGMQKSEELSDISLELVKQVQELGDKTWFCAFNIYDDDPRGSVEWGSNGKGTFPMYRTPREGIFLRYYEAGQQGESFLINEIGEDECPDHYEYLCSLPGVGEQLLGMKANGIPFPSSQIDHVAFFKYGYVLFITYDPVPESHDIFKRFAKVFEQSYTRFLDLQKAEASAREAQIENALERIRSRTMGMQTGEELKDVVVLLYKELIALGVTNFVTCGYVEIHEDKQIQDTWVTSPGGDTFGLFYLPLQGDATFDARYAAWKKQEPIFHQTVAGQQRSDHLEYAITKFNSKEAEEMVRSQFPDPTVFYCFNFSHGYLHIVGGSLLEKEEELLIARFTKVFEQTYTRFLDLKNAEAATREALIEAALERVRAVATAMRSSDELLKVMQHIHKEFSALGFPCGAFWNSRYLDTHYEKAVTGMDGEQVTAIMELPRDFSMIPELAAWERGNEKLGVFKFGTEASIEYLNHMINKGKFLEIVPGVLTEELLREKGGWTFVQARTTHGELGYNLWGETDPSKEATDSLLRFAAVFDLAYQRYHDLVKAEEDYQALLEEKARTEKALSDLQATQKQLIEQEKLASLGSLTAGIAHEIKNPLNFVNNFAEVSRELVDELAEALGMGQDGGPTGADGASAKEARAIMADLRANADQIAKHGGRADAIVRSMMQHARGGTAERETVDVNAFVAEYIDLAWHGMRAKDHTFDCEVERALVDDAGSAELQPQDMGRVLLNLLNNAFYATQMEDAAPDARVRVATSREDDRIVITVADNGPGIPEDIRQKIFEPFFTTKPTGEGTGLGLSLSHDIVTKGHGGSLAVQNAEDGGAEFIVTLPSH